MNSLNPNLASEMIDMKVNFGLGVHEPRLLKPSEAATFLGVDWRTLKKYRLAGEIKYLKLSDRTFRYRVSDLLQYLTGRAR